MGVLDPVSIPWKAIIECDDLDNTSETNLRQRSQS